MDMENDSTTYYLGDLLISDFDRLNNNHPLYGVTTTLKRGGDSHNFLLAAMKKIVGRADIRFYSDDMKDENWDFERIVCAGRELFEQRINFLDNSVRFITGWEDGLIRNCVILNFSETYQNLLSKFNQYVELETENNKLSEAIKTDSISQETGVSF